MIKINTNSIPAQIKSDQYSLQKYYEFFDLLNKNKNDLEKVFNEKMLELKTKINENNHQIIAKEILALQAVHSYLTTEKQSEYLKKKIMEEEQNENIRNQYVNEVNEIKENELIRKIDEKTAIQVAQINIPHD